MTPSRSQLLVLALLAVLVAVPGAVHSASAGTAGWPSWWDDHWHIRVPITVNPQVPNLLDPQGKPLNVRGTAKDHLVVVPLDLGELMAQAGWPSDLGHLSSFALDPTSARLVRTSGFTADDVPLEQVPARFYPGDFTAHTISTFDPATNPVGTLVFREKGVLDGPRTYDLYLDVTQNPRVPGASGAPPTLPSSASTWTGMGSFIVGRTVEPASGQPAEITVTALQDDTHVRVDRVPAPYQVLPGDICDLTKDADALAQYASVTCRTGYGTVYQVVSDHPVLVTQHEAGADGGSAFTFFPSTTGGLVGNSIVVRTPGDTPSDASVDIVCLDPHGCGQSFNVATYDRTGRQVSGFTQGWNPTFSASGQLSHTTLTVPRGTTTVLQGSGRMAAALPGAGVQAPPTLLGAVRGLQTVLPARSNLALAAPGSGSVQAYDLGSGRQVVPQDQETYPASDHLWNLDLPSSGSLYTVRTTTPATVLGGDPRDRAVTPLGLDANLTQDLVVPPRGTLTIVPLYDATSVSVDRYTEGAAVHVCCDQTLGSGAYTTISESGGYHVEASKPVSLLVTQGTGRNPVSAVVGGRPASLQATVGTPQFWGYAGQLDVQAGSDAVRNVRPGDDVVFNLTLTNLGRSPDGGSLTDGFTLATQVAEPRYRSNWTVQASTRHVGGLGTHQSANLTVLVHVPKDAAKGTIVDVNVTAVSDGNPNLVAKRTLRLVVTEYHAFSLTFLDGSTQQDRVAQGDPPYNFTLAVHNDGTSTDTIDLQRILTPSPVGWNVALVFPNGTDASRVTLEPNGTEQLALSIAPRGTPDQPWISVRVVGASEDQPSLKHDVEATLVLKVNLGLRILVDQAERTVPPGGNVTFNVTVVNTGDAGTAVIERQGPVPPGFNAVLRGPHGTPLNGSARLDLTANGTATDRQNLTLTVSAAPSLLGGDSFETILLGHIETSIPGVDASDFVVVKATVATLHNVTIPPDPVAVRPSRPQPLGLLLTNHGNAEVSFHLRPRSLPPGWNVTVPGDDLRLAMGASQRANLVVSPPVGAPPGPANVTLEVVYDDGATQLLPLPIQVEPTTAFDAEVAGPAPAMAPGANLTVPVQLTNVGNTRTPLRLHVDTPDGVNANLTPALLQLAPGDAGTLRLQLRTSPDVHLGNHTLVVRDQAGDAVANVTLRVAPLDLAITSVNLQGDLRQGQTVAFVAKVANHGGVLARNVNVSLLRGDHLVDHRTIDRLPAGADAVAALQWTVDGDGSNLRVTVTSPSGVDAHPSDDTVDALSVAHANLPAPGVATVATAALAVALVLQRRWRS